MRSECQDISWQARLHPTKGMHADCWADIHSTAQFNYLVSLRVLLEVMAGVISFNGRVCGLWHTEGRL